MVDRNASFAGDRFELTEEIVDTPQKCGGHSHAQTEERPFAGERAGSWFPQIGALPPKRPELV